MHILMKHSYVLHVPEHRQKLKNHFKNVLITHFAKNNHISSILNFLNINLI